MTIRYLQKPRRGRHAAGNVGSWAARLNVGEAVLRACEHNPGMYNDLVNIPVFVGYLGGTAGYAGYRPAFYMELHVELMPEKWVKDLKETFLHEVGHLIDALERGDSDHGSRWKRVMARLGALNETRCHSMNHLRQAKVRLTCDGIVTNAKTLRDGKWVQAPHRPCGNWENTTKPETYSGKKCPECATGRLRYNPK